MRKLLLVLFILCIVSNLFPFTFDFKETNLSFALKVIEDTYKNILITNLVVNSSYIDSFVRENFRIDKFSSYLVVSNNALYVNIVSSNTNFFIKRLPIPFVEGLEVLFLLSSKDYFSNFKKAGILDYGSVKLLRLYYNDVASIILYVSQNEVARVDYILTQGRNEMMVWSYLCAYSKSKVSDKSYLSGILLNIEAKEFYKFDFVPY